MTGAADLLRVERSGGFGGLVLTASVPLSDLSAPERAAVDDCLQAPSAPPAPPATPDRFVYRLLLGRRERLVQEEALSQALRQLFARLVFTPSGR